MSPSTRREWIEIDFIPRADDLIVSPSTRREWIEIALLSINPPLALSPSTRREWIEMGRSLDRTIYHRVSLHTEGVD